MASDESNYNVAVKVSSQNRAYLLGAAQNPTTTYKEAPRLGQSATSLESANAKIATYNHEAQTEHLKYYTWLTELCLEGRLSLESLRDDLYTKVSGSMTSRDPRVDAMNELVASPAYKEIPATENPQLVGKIASLLVTQRFSPEDVSALFVTPAPAL